MKKLLLLFVLLSSQVFGQDNKDWILPKEGDTIRCDISKATKQSLYYKVSGGSTTILSMSKVATYSKGGESAERTSVITDCKYAIDEVDKFTKVRKLYTKPVPLMVKALVGTVYGSGVVLDDLKMFRLGISSYVIISIDKGAKVMLMTSSDSVITLQSLEYVVAESSFVAGQTTWLTTIRCLISEEQIEHLINDRLTDVRYYTTKGYVDFEVKEKRISAFQHMLRCIQ